jgi:rhodanese-related sulfurtransferase
MKKRYGLLAVSIIFTLLFFSQGETRSSILDISSDDAFSMIEKGTVVIDVREKAEWDEAHIEGAILIPKSSLDAGDPLAWKVVEALPKEDRIIIHCKGGVRSMAVAKKLQERGYKKIYNMDGMDYWIEKGYPYVS